MTWVYVGLGLALWIAIVWQATTDYKRKGWVAPLRRFLRKSNDKE